MSLRRELLVSLGLQGAGAAAVLLATLFLGARLGPEAQGEFSGVKAELEFVCAFALFGLPQTLFFHAKAGKLDGRAALRWVCGSALLAALWAVIYTAWRGEPGPVRVLMAMAVVAMVVHNQLRALLLVGERMAWFNVLTAMPQVLVLLAVLGVLAAPAPVDAQAWRWPSAFALAFAVAAALAWLRLRASPWRSGAEAAGWREIVRYGLAAWLQAALVTSAVLAAQRWVESSQGAAALGQFTMAMTLVQVPLTPISYAAPLLFRRWMERPGAAASKRIAAALFGLLLAAAALCWLIALVVPDLGLGPAYDGATRAVALLLAGGAAEAASRVLVVQASASGSPWVAVRAEAARWGVLLLAWWMLDAPTLESACAAWAVGALAGAGVVWAASWRAAP